MAESDPGRRQQAANRSAEDPALQHMLSHALPAPDSTIAPFTDEYAPVDRYIGELSLRPAIH